MTKMTVTENADTIVTTKPTKTAVGDVTHGQDADDRRWVEAVIASLPSRSSEARKALAKALLDGETAITSVGHGSGLEHDPRKPVKNRTSKSISRPDNSTPHVSGTSIPLQSADKPQESAIPSMATTHPVSGTTSSKIAELSRFPARSLPDCHTRTRHTMLGQSCSSPWNDSEAWGTDRHTKVKGVKLCFIPLTS